ncbi:MAG TPA: hypothetical protein VFL17_01445 [Anaerolineae bacterium]|nr:hypothetical protein [Anaerolineae bacterium]
MKKSLFVVLTLMAVSLMVAAPALAKRPSGDECAHDVATVAALRECVEHAIHHGHIDDPEVAKSLLALLDAAQDAVDRGQEDVAVDILRAFIQEVKAQAGKHIAEPHASHLIEHAQIVIRALSE